MNIKALLSHCREERRLKQAAETAGEEENEEDEDAEGGGDDDGPVAFADGRAARETRSLWATG